MRHAFEAATTKKEVALQEALNVKNKVLCLKNELCQVGCLDNSSNKSAKSNFMGMQNQLDNSLAENEKYYAQLPTLQDRLIVIQANLNHLQAKTTKLVVEY